MSVLVVLWLLLQLLLILLIHAPCILWVLVHLWLSRHTLSSPRHRRWRKLPLLLWREVRRLHKALLTELLIRHQLLLLLCWWWLVLLLLLLLLWISHRLRRQCGKRLLAGKPLVLGLWICILTWLVCRLEAMIRRMALKSRELRWRLSCAGLELLLWRAWKMWRGRHKRGAHRHLRRRRRQWRIV